MMYNDETSYSTTLQSFLVKVHVLPLLRNILSIILPRYLKVCINSKMSIQILAILMLVNRQPIVQHIWTGLRLKVFWVLFFPLKRNFLPLMPPFFMKANFAQFSTEKCVCSRLCIHTAIDSIHSVEYVFNTANLQW